MTPREYLKCMVDNNILKVVPESHTDNGMDHRWKLTDDGCVKFRREGLTVFDWHGIQYDNDILRVWIPKKVDSYLILKGNYQGGWKWANADEVDLGEFNKYAAYILGIFGIASNHQEEYVDLDNIVF